MFFNRNRQENRATTAYPTDFGFDWSTWLSGGDMNDTVLKDNGYFSGLAILGQTVAKLPITIKQKTDKGEVEAINHYLYDILKLRFNTEMSAFDAKKALIVQSKHYGVAGLYVQRDLKQNILGLYPCRVTQMTIDPKGLINSAMTNKVLVDFICCNVEGYCFSKDIILLKDNSINGITSKATKTYINDTINSNISALSYQTELFSNGMTSKLVVQSANDIKDKTELNKLQTKFNNLYSANGRIFTIPMGVNVTPISLDLQSSQFAELRKLGKQEVAVALGVPFSLLETGSLNGEDNIAYLQNQIQPILSAIEDEMNYKLLTPQERKAGYFIEFDVSEMLRVDPLNQSLILDRYVRDGIMTLNDAKRQLGIKLVEGGDLVTYPSGQVTLDNLIKGNATWQKDNSNTGNNDSGEGGDNNNE